MGALADIETRMGANRTGPASYRNDWGCPRLAGVTGGGLEIRPKPGARTESGVKTDLAAGWRGSG
jgi:hypothetical protein